MAHNKGTFILLLILAAVFAAAAYLYFFAEEQQVDRRFGGGAVQVRTAAAGTQDFSDVIEALGTAQANESVTLTSRVADTVEKVNFEDGMTVEEGAILVELINSEEVAQLTEAEANVRQAEQQYDRVVELVQRGNASQASLDTAVRARQEAKSRLAVAEARMADKVVRAPFAGILGFRTVSPGTLVTPGTAITTLDDISIIKLDFSVPETLIEAVRIGQEIQTKAATFQGRLFTGTVKTISSRVDPVTRAVTVRAELPNPDGLIRPGMLMTVDLISNRRVALAVPESALVPVADNQFVFRVVGDNRVEQITVATGGRKPGWVEILQGLNQGDQVVVSGTFRLRPGVEIDILSYAESPGRPEAG